MPPARHPLPPSLPPRGLAREEAAAYLGLGATLFDQMVRDGRMPRPRVANARRVWDRLELDSAFAALPHAGDGVAAGEPADGDQWAVAL
ncbi:MAG: hypothetical protein NW216_02570 [Hyphomicrobium sp.]|nr:hypothetical protein [Hyphomicrobium sp.]